MQVQRARLFGGAGGGVDALKALPLEELLELARRDAAPASQAAGQRLEGFDGLITGTAVRDADDDDADD